MNLQYNYDYSCNIAPSLDHSLTLLVASVLTSFQTRRHTSCWHPAGNTTPRAPEAHANLCTYERHCEAAPQLVVKAGKKRERLRKSAICFSWKLQAAAAAGESLGFNQCNSPLLISRPTHPRPLPRIRARRAAPPISEPPQCIFTRHYDNTINRIHPHLESSC